MQEKSSRSSVARTEGSRNPGKGVMHLIARHHGEIARVRRLARAPPGRLATEPFVPLVGGAELLRVDFHPSVPRIFVDFVTRISYNSSSSKICVDHRPVAGRFAVCQSTSAQRRARAPLNSVQIHAHRRPHCAFFAQSGGVPARQADISGRRTSWMGRSVSARPPADERESPEDQKPDEKREQPSFRPSKQDPFYLGLRDDLRKARRTARRNIDNARRRQRRAADPDHRDKCRAQSHGLSLQDYRAMRERQKNVCGICKTPGKPLCVDHCHATGKVRGLLCRDCNLGLGNYKDNPVFTRAATAYLEAARRDDGNQRSAAGEGLDSISRSRVQQEPAPSAGESPKSCNTAAVFADLELQIHRTGGGGGKSQGNLQENSGPATCPLQACRPNCR